MNPLKDIISQEIDQILPDNFGQSMSRSVQQKIVEKQRKKHQLVENIKLGIIVLVFSAWVYWFKDYKFSFKVDIHDAFPEKFIMNLVGIFLLLALFWSELRDFNKKTSA